MENHVTIVVKENAEGINPSLMQGLFTKFTKSVDGNGLGLYISKKIIEANGGSMWAENNKEGSGARFCFNLPVYKSNIK